MLLHPKCKLLKYSLSCSIFFISLSAQASDNLNLDVKTLREQSVLLVRGGEINKGLQQLKSLLQSNPNDQMLLADYLVLSYNHQIFPQNVDQYVDSIQVKNYPNYAKIQTIKLLRDTQHFQKALDLAEQFYQVDAQPYLLIWQARLLLDMHNIAQSKAVLKNIKLDLLDADALAFISTLYFNLNMPVEALETAQLSLKKQITFAGQEAYVLALTQNGNFSEAKNYINQQQIHHSNLNTQIHLEKFAQDTANAITFSQVTSYRNQSNDAYLKLDQVIQEMTAFQDQLSDDPKLRQRFYFDYLYVLNQRNRAKDVIAIVEKQQFNPNQMPAYVRHALADAYLKDQQPEHAEPLYLSLLKEKNYADYTVYAGLYYSYIEQEKFKDANILIDTMDQVLPQYLYSDAKGVDRVTHPDRNAYLSLKGLNYAYRNEQAKAEQYFEALVAKTPSNISYINNLALIQRWREKPLLSEQTLSQLNGVQPVSQSTQLNQMQNAQARSQIEDWRELNQLLVQRMQDDTGVIKSQKELKDREHFSIVHASRWMKSRSEDQDLLNQLKGSRDQTHWTRLNSPWITDHYRIFAEQDYRWAKYTNDKIHDQRVGLGLEWSQDHTSASLTLSDSVNYSSRFGVRLDWSQRLNDHWSYQLGLNSQANIPLQAIQDGYKGEAYLVGINWQQNESRKAGMQYQLTHIDDGNTRQETFAYVDQQIFQAPHHLTRARLSGYLSQNDIIDNANYFNPENSHSIELSLRHEWMTWRHYEQHFNQIAEVTIGVFGQKEYSSKPIYNLFYGHEWKVSRTWKMNYGIGWGMHPYDGQDEKNTYAVFGFEGVF